MVQNSTSRASEFNAIAGGFSPNINLIHNFISTSSGCLLRNSERSTSILFIVKVKLLFFFKFIFYNSFGIRGEKKSFIKKINVIVLTITCRRNCTSYDLVCIVERITNFPSNYTHLKMLWFLSPCVLKIFSILKK